MSVDSSQLVEFITSTINHEVIAAGTVTQYRDPLISFVDANDPRFSKLREVADPGHMMPQDLLPGAKSILSFFLPFDPGVVDANAQHKEEVALEWVKAYIETNALINRITANLVSLLSERNIQAAAEPATDNFDHTTLTSRWSHKSVAVIAGLGSFGLHHLVITDAGCAGRFGSLVMDAELSIPSPEFKERCLYFYDGSCLECVLACPVDALDENNEIDKQQCWNRCLGIAKAFAHLGQAEVCGKCSIGPCSLRSSV